MRYHDVIFCARIFLIESLLLRCATRSIVMQNACSIRDMLAQFKRERQHICSMYNIGYTIVVVQRSHRSQAEYSISVRSEMILCNAESFLSACAVQTLHFCATDILKVEKYCEIVYASRVRLCVQTITVQIRIRRALSGHIKR